MTREYHILNLGAGVQSTTLYLLNMDGEIVPRFDCAIFADTQDEPRAVYEHLVWLESLGGPPILRATRGCLSSDLMRGENSTGQRFASIPCYTAAVEGVPLGIVRRQCTKEYKIEVIERTIRHEVLKLQPRCRIPKGVLVTSYYGISLDEKSRASRIFEIYKFNHARKRCAFPLIDRRWTRQDCRRYLEGRVPHRVPRSACKQCPFHADEEWRRMKAEDLESWQGAVAVDEALRKPGLIVNRKLDQKLYLHRSCRPLAEVDFTDNQTGFTFADECLGMCGV